jgi:hypothetical protein
MTKKLAVVVLGNRNAGKSETWKRLFNEPNIRTTKNIRRLYLTTDEYVEAFLINGSPEERKKNIEEMLTIEAQILCCSIQYKKQGLESIRTLYKKGYEVFIHWLNPGYNDTYEYPDNLHVIDEISQMDKCKITKVSGKKHLAESRVDELRKYILEWATKNKVIYIKGSKVIPIKN